MMENIFLIKKVVSVSLLALVISLPVHADLTNGYFEHALTGWSATGPAEVVTASYRTGSNIGVTGNENALLLWNPYDIDNDDNDNDTYPGLNDFTFTTAKGVTDSEFDIQSFLNTYNNPDLNIDSVVSRNLLVNGTGTLSFDVQIESFFDITETDIFTATLAGTDNTYSFQFNPTEIPPDDITIEGTVNVDANEGVNDVNFNNEFVYLIKEYNITFTDILPDSYDLTFVLDNYHDNVDEPLYDRMITTALIDNVTLDVVNVIPAPGSLVLAGIGLGTGGILFRRRKA